MKNYRIKGSTLIIKASCIKQAILKLVSEDWDEIKWYERHWYTKSKKKSWAEVETTYGYRCIVEEY